tara:strand:- start:105 stop:425 length:321 start_codon:yes stop_codon:yes gene_type:complete
LKYIYYHPVTKQVEAVFETPNLSVQSGWHDQGLQRAIIPDGMVLDTRDFKIDSVIVSDGNEVVDTYSVSVNPVVYSEPSDDDIKETYRLASADEKQAMLAQRMGFI